LADSGGAEGNEVVVDSVDNELVLGGLGKLNGASGVEVDEMTFLSSEEVLDLNLLLILGDDGVDGEMCMYHSHLVSEAL
jgi:hypothetical protein